MVCAQCASEIHEGTLTCANCAGPQAAAASPDPSPFAGTLLDLDRDLEGLSGWLILVGIGLVVSPFMILSSTLGTHLPILIGAQHREFLRTHPGLHALIAFVAITNLVFVAVLAALNYLFFTKKRSFPTFIILYFVFHLIVIVADPVLGHILLPSIALSTSTISNIARALAGAALWVPYFLCSRRVKVTFVN